MDIKQYDIVSYQDKLYRVVIPQHMINKGYILDMFGNVSSDDITVVESVTVPEFNVGDHVVIKPLSHECDRDIYVPPYNPCDFVGAIGTIEKINNMFGCLLDNGCWVNPYQLEKMQEYDMI